MLEKDIEKKVCDYAKQVGFLVYKFSSPNHVGVPDRMFVGQYQHVFWIEFKAKGKQPTPVQEREARKLIDCGFEVFLVDDVEYGKEIVREQHEISKIKNRLFIAAVRHADEMEQQEQEQATRH